MAEMDTGIFNFVFVDISLTWLSYIFPWSWYY